MLICCVNNLYQYKKYVILIHDVLLLLCKQTSDVLFRKFSLAVSCLVHTFKPGDKITP